MCHQACVTLLIFCLDDLSICPFTNFGVFILFLVDLGVGLVCLIFASLVFVFVFFQVGLYFYKLPSQNCFSSILYVLSYVYIVICFQVYFYFIFISSVTCLLFRSVLFSLHVFSASLSFFLVLCAGSETQSSPTPCEPMDCSPSGFPVHGISQARILTLEWIAISFSRGSSRPRG